MIATCATWVGIMHTVRRRYGVTTRFPRIMFMPQVNVNSPAVSGGACLRCRELVLSPSLRCRLLISARLCHHHLLVYRALIHGLPLSSTARFLR